MTRSARARSGAEIRLAAAICLLFGARSRGSLIDGDSMPDLIQADSPGSLPRLFRKGFPISAMTNAWFDRRAIAAHDSEHLDEVAPPDRAARDDDRIARQIGRSVAPEVRKEPENGRGIAPCCVLPELVPKMDRFPFPSAAHPLRL